MVSIFVGAGSGFARGSGSIVGGAGLLGSGTQGRSGESVSVNAATGNLLITREDEFLIGRGPDVSISRTYNSFAQASDGDNGDQWQQSTMRRVFGLTGTLNAAGSTVRRQGGDGLVILYSYKTINGVAAYWATDGDGSHDKLARQTAGDNWTWTDGSSQWTETYETSVADASLFRIKDQKDTDGNTLGFTYVTATDKLDRVTTANHGSPNSGEQSYVEYIWSGNNITQIVTGYTDYGANNDPAATADDVNRTLTRTRYAYDGSNRLITVTVDLSPENNSVADGKTYVTNYTYDGSDRVASITQTDGSSLLIAYDSAGRVATLTQAVAGSDVRVTRIGYGALTGGAILGANMSSVTGPDGQVTRMWYDIKGQLVQLMSPPATPGGLSQVLQFEYDANGNLLRTIETDSNNASTPNNLVQTASWGDGEGATRGDNLVDDSGWPQDVDGTLPAAGTIGQGWTGAYTGETEWTVTTGPYGKQIVSLHAGQTNTTDAGGGASSESFAIDKSKAYEFTLYFRADALNKHGVYFGLGSGVVKNGTNGAYNGNPYFMSGLPGSGIEAGKWYKIVGYVLPGSTPLEAAGSYGGVYDVETGERVETATHFIWDETQTDTTSIARLFNYYNTHNQGKFTHFFKPEVREVADAAILRGSETLDIARDRNLLESPQVSGWPNAPIIVGDGEARWDEMLGPDGAWQVGLQTGQFDEVADGGGAYTNLITIDPAKTYRFTQYVRKSDLTRHGIYFGLTGGSPPYVKNAATGATDTNPYFYLSSAANQQATLDENAWYKIVGYVLPEGSVNIAAGSLGGVYDARTGERVADSVAFRWNEARPNDQVYARFFTYYDQALPGWSTDWLAPEVLEIAAADLAADNANPFGVTYDEGGRITVYTYDTMGNMLTSTDANNNRVTRTYGDKNEMLTETRTASVAGAAPTDVTTRYVYDGENHLRYVVSAEGHVVRYHYNADGQLYWRNAFPESVFDLGELTASQAPALAAMDSWVNGVAGTAGSERTSVEIEYSKFDGRGNIWWTRDYGASLNVNNASNDEGYKTINFAYDQAGRLLSRYHMGENAERFLYDGMGRLVAAADLSGGVTTYRFDDANTTTLVHHATGLTQTRVYNKAGDLIGETSSTPGYQPDEFFNDLTNWNSVRVTRTDAAPIGGANAYTYTVDADGFFGAVSKGLVVAAGETVTWRITVKGNPADVHRIGIQGATDSWGTLADTDASAVIISGPGSVSNVGSYAGLFDLSGLSATQATVIELRRTYTQAQTATGYFYIGGTGSSVPAGTAVTLAATNLTKTFTNAAEAIASTTTYRYDELGRIRMITTPLGVATSGNPNDYNSFILYDDVGRKTANIAADGSVVEYRYDAAGRLAATVAYATKLDATKMGNLATAGGIAEIAGYRPGATASDIWSWSIYDAGGQLIQSIDGDGGVVNFFYDASNRLVKTRAYATKIAVAALKLTVPTARQTVTGTGDDHIARNFYDADGRLIGALDGEGYLSETVYNHAGRKIDEIAYAAKTSSDLWAAGTFAQLRDNAAPMSAANRHLRYVRDGQGLLRYLIDNAGYVTSFAYNFAGRLTSTIAHAAKIATDDFTDDAVFTYDAVDMLVTDPATGLANPANDRQSYNVYNAKGQVAYTVGAAGGVTGFTYDIAGHVVKSVAYASAYATSTLPVLTTLNTWAAGQAANAGNRVTRSWYSAAGELRFSVDGEGYVTRYDYDADGNISAERRSPNKVTASDATTIAQIDTLANAAGTPIVTAYSYDAAGRVEYATDGEGYRTRNIWSGTGELTSVYAAWGTSDQSETRYTYDGAGRVLSEARVDDGTTLSAVQYQYTAFGEVKQLTDARGKITTYAYDDRGLRISATDPLDGVTAYAYNGFGEIVKTTDAGDGITRQYYDDQGRLVYTIDAEKNVSRLYYNGFGDVRQSVRYATSFTATDATTTANLNSSLGAETATPPGTAAVTTYAYDKRGLVLTATDPAGTTTSTYNAFGNVLTVARADATTTFEYDNRGLVRKTTDAEGWFESYGYDAFGNRTSVVAKSKDGTKVAGGTTTYSYDKRGLLLTETLPIASYNADGSVQGVIVNSYAYDARGNRTQMIEASGLAEARRTTYEYDKLDRLTKTIGDERLLLSQTNHNSTATFIPADAIAYDPAGNILRMTDAAGGRSVYFYDDLGRRTVEIDAAGTYTKYAYDANGNVLSTRVYETKVASIPSNGGADTATGAGAPGTAFRKTTFTYDKLDRLKTTSVAGVTSGSYADDLWTPDPSDITTIYDYDAFGNVVKVIDANGNASFNYYDTAGRKTVAVDAKGYKTLWTYDEEGNVLTERRYANQFTGTPTTTAPPTVLENAADRNTTFTYDKNGNRLSEARSDVVIHDNAAPGTATTAGAVTVTWLYNGLGQVVRKTEATGDQVNYAYDAAGRLLTETRAAFSDFEDTTPTTSPNATPTVDYRYDGLGNLVQTLAAGKGTTTLARETRYAYGAGGLLASMTDAEGVVHSYSYDKRGVRVRDQYYRANAAGTNVMNAVLTKVDVLGRTIEQTVAAWSGTAWIKGEVATTEYNAYGEVSSSGINGGAVPEANRLWQTENKYDAAGRLWATNAGDGVWKQFGYDKAGNRTVALTSAGYDLAGKSFATALGQVGQASLNATYTVYDARGLAKDVIEEGRQLAAGPTETLTSSRTYNAFGEVLTETDALGAVTRYSYNTIGKLIRSEGPGVAITLENGKEIWVKPAQDYYYDASGRLVATRDANGTYAETGTSAANATAKAANTGNLTRLTLLAGTGYNGSEALVTAQTHADNGVIITRYDIHGDARRIYNELNTVYSASGPATVKAGAVFTANSYDRLGRLTEAAHAGGLIDYYDYDSVGQRIKHWTNAPELTGEVEETDYDVQGRVTRTRAFGGDVTTTSYAWDANVEAIAGTVTGGWSEVTTMANSRTLTEKSDLFGRTTWKEDLGDHVTTYAYDVAGRQTSSMMGGATSTFSWYNSGLLASNANATGTESYTYDKAGNRLTEHMVTTGQVLKSATASYDAMNRLTSWAQTSGTWAPASSTTHSYDANGNIRKTVATSTLLGATGTAAGALDATYWFRFDSMNRLVVDKGRLSGTAGASGTTIVRSDSRSTSHDILYNLAGERTEVRTTLNVPESSRTHPYTGDLIIIPARYWETREAYGYDDAGRLATVKISQGSDTETLPLPAAATPTVVRSQFEYDLLGRLTGQTDYDSDGTTEIFDRTVTYNAKSQITEDDSSTRRWKAGGGSDLMRSRSTYGYGSGSGYALGNALSVATQTWKNGTDGGSSGAPDTATTTVYGWYDGAVQASVSFDPDTGSSGALGVTTYSYDARGLLTAVHVDDGRERDVTFVNDVNGQAVRRDEADLVTTTGDPHERWYRFGGREMGYSGNNGNADMDYATSITDRYSRAPVWDGPFRGEAGATARSHTDFTGSYDAYNSYEQGSASGRYTARAGETLASVAASLYGDANLWYKLAAANGLGANTNLSEGQQLTLPAGVMKNSHNASTFKPYDPADIIGDTMPTTPKPPKGAKCGAFGQILVAAIAIGLSIALPHLSPAFQGFWGGVAAAGVGSTVSQGFAVASGIQDKFDWKSVALSMVTAGVADKVGGFSFVEKMSSKFVQGAVSGALSSAISQGIGVATGLQSKFDFAGVAAAGVGGGVNSWTQGRVGTAGSYGSRLAGTSASAIASAATRSAITGGSFGDNLLQVLPNIIGQALGGAFAGGPENLIPKTFFENPAAVADGGSTVGDEAEFLMASMEPSLSAPSVSPLRPSRSVLAYLKAPLDGRPQPFEMLPEAKIRSNLPSSEQHARTMEELRQEISVNESKSVVSGILNFIKWGSRGGAIAGAIYPEDTGGLDYVSLEIDGNRWGMVRRAEEGGAYHTTVQYGGEDVFAAISETPYENLYSLEVNGSVTIGENRNNRILMINDNGTKIGYGVVVYNDREEQIYSEGAVNGWDMNRINLEIDIERGKVARGAGAAKGVRQPFIYGDFIVDNHGNMPSPRPGQESHHGVMSKWMTAHYGSYNSNLAPAVLMPAVNHRATFSVYNTWRAEQRREMGGKFDWAQVSESNMRHLSDRMFDAAQVPDPVRNDYWNRYDSMKRKLSK